MITGSDCARAPLDRTTRADHASGRASPRALRLVVAPDDFINTLAVLASQFQGLVCNLPIALATTWP